MATRLVMPHSKPGALLTGRPRGRRVMLSTRAIPSEYTSVSLVSLSEEEKRYWRTISVDEEALAALAGPVPTDFYQLLGLEFDPRPTARGVSRAACSASLGSYFMPQGDGSEAGGPLTPDTIKAAYRRLQRLAHPDIAGEAATELSALLNQAYVTLSDDHARSAYDSELATWRTGMGTYDGRPVSFWAGPPDEQRAVFVDETSCIGCMNCTIVAPSTFYMEDEWGRARVHTQWGDTEEYVREAIATCPVDCIAFVDRQQLPLLEYVMKGCKRENVALMGRRRSGNMGSAPASQSPFVQAEAFVKARKRAGLEELVAGVARLHDSALASTISRAWLSLPPELRAKGWPGLSGTAVNPAA